MTFDLEIVSTWWFALILFASDSSLKILGQDSGDHSFPFFVQLKIRVKSRK